MAHIETATGEHVEGIIELSQQGWRDIIHATGVNPNVLRKNLNDFIFMAEYYVRVAVDDGKVVGAFCGRVAPTWWSEDWVAEGIGVYILPEYRGKGLAVPMYKGFMEWAEGYKRVKNIRLQTSAGGLDMTKFFNRLGTHQIGGVYIKEVNRS